VQGRRRIAVATARPGPLFALVFLGTLFLDQATKIAVRIQLVASESVELIDGLLAITYVRNTGAAFGLMPGQQTLFIIVAVVVLTAVAVYWYRARPAAVLVVVALGLVSAGAVGNFIDRMLVGRVTDFIDVFADLFPVFNIADSALIVGVAMLMLWVVLGPDSSESDEEVAEAAADDAAMPEGAPDTEVEASTDG
jgi:signal peptidase II